MSKHRRTVKNSEELRSSALARGSTVVVDGKPFNSTRARVNPGRQQLTVAKNRKTTPAPDPVPEPKVETPAPVVVQVDNTEVLADNARVLSVLTKLLEIRDREPSADILVATSPRNWQFDITRDDRGLIKGMTAKAI